MHRKKSGSLNAKLSFMVTRGTVEVWDGWVCVEGKAWKEKQRRKGDLAFFKVYFVLSEN